jgi:hypothetical protein
MEPFHLDFTSVLIQIDCSEARHIENDTKNGGIYDDLYPHSWESWFKKKDFENSLSYEQLEHTVG